MSGDQRDRAQRLTRRECQRPGECAGGTVGSEPARRRKERASLRERAVRGGPLESSYVLVRRSDPLAVNGVSSWTAGNRRHAGRPRPVEGQVRAITKPREAGNAGASRRQCSSSRCGRGWRDGLRRGFIQPVRRRRLRLRWLPPARWRRRRARERGGHGLSRQRLRRRRHDWHHTRRAQHF